MPDPVTHYVFGQQVMAQLPEEVRKAANAPYFQRALQGPDPWSCLGVFGGKDKRYSRRGVEMHRTKSGQFLTALTHRAKEDEAMFPVLAGFICHYCLDRLTHPYIVCKGGIKDGGHTRIERAIDSYYIRTVYGKAPWHFSMPRNVFSCKRYPESLRQGLNAAHREVYGWEDVFPMLNQSLRDERRFYGLMQDPFGIVHMLLRLLPGKTNYSLYSYFHREIDGKRLDYLNENHTPWQHPYAPETQSTDSFFDLFDRAKNEAAALIQAAYAWMTRGEDFPQYENSNYSTGLDCDDPRNLQDPQCQPLVYGGKYWN